MQCNHMRAHVRTDFTATPGRPFEQAILPHMMAATICADGIYFRRRNRMCWKQKTLKCVLSSMQSPSPAHPFKAGGLSLSFSGAIGPSTQSI